MKIEYTFTNKSDGNLAYYTTKNIEEVALNRLNMAKKYGFELSNIRYMKQIHGSNVEIVTKISPQEINNCDAIVTNNPDISLMVMVADCVPILLKDKEKGVIAAIHAGRESTFLDIASKTATIMIEEFKSKPENIEAVFGPSIQKCCYEVSHEIANFAQKKYGKEFLNGRYLDLQSINEKQLRDIGLVSISKSKICTCCYEKDDFYSYRKNKATNRFAGIIQIK